MDEWINVWINGWMNGWMGFPKHGHSFRLNPTLLIFIPPAKTDAKIEVVVPSPHLPR